MHYSKVEGTTIKLKRQNTTKSENGVNDKFNTTNFLKLTLVVNPKLS